MIRLENVNKFYSNNDVTSLGLVNVNLEFKRGEIVVITGESGSGKSTLLNVVTKVDKFDEGEIYYFGEETSYFGIDEMDQFRKDKVGFIFQNYNILESYTVLDNVMLPLLINGMEKKEAKKKAIELIKKVGLESRLKNRGSKLSGGEKQRCVIARALAMSSDILACDEPTGNLDSKTGAEIVELIKEVADNKLVLIVTHNYDQFKDIATRKIRIHDGEIVEDSVIKKPAEEKEEKLELNTTPAKRSVDYKISLKSLKNTPFKTILSSVIFLFICIFFLFLSSYLFSVFNQQAFETEFSILNTNKLIITNSRNQLSKMDIDSFIGQKGINQFYYTNPAQGYYSEDSYNTDSYSGLGAYFSYEEYPQDLDISGRMPQNENECIVLLPKGYTPSWQINSISLYDNRFKVVGIEYRSDVKYTRSYEPVFVVSGNERIKTIMQVHAIILSRFYDFIEENNLDTYIDVEYDFNSKTKISEKFGDYIKYYDYDLIETAGVEKISEDKIVIGYDFNDLISKRPYELAVYGNKTINSTNAKLRGLKVIDVYTYNFADPMYALIMKISSYVIVLFCAAYLIGIYYLTYALIGRLYDSKIKDFAILRTLGINKKDMARITRVDIMLQMLVTETIVLATAIILSRVLPQSPFTAIIRPDIGIVILYLILMNLISFLLSRKIHKRIYQKTIAQSLGGMKND